MLDLMRVAVMGGCSSGKSTVCQMFEKMGAGVVYADAIVKSLLEIHPKTKRAVVDLLGNEVVLQEKIDKAKVARLVFSNKKFLKKLESHLHPEVFKKIEEKFSQFSSKGGYPLLIAEVPLLYEAGYAACFHAVVVILCDEKVAQARSPYKENFPQRMARLWPQTKKAMMADYVITNNGTLQDLHNKAEALYQKLINRGEKT